MRDMLHDQGEKRKAETGASIEATAQPRARSVVVTGSLPIADSPK